MAAPNAPLAGAPPRDAALGHASFALVGRRAWVVGRVLSARRLTAIDFAAFRLEERSAARTAALLREQRFDR
jgi:hypothetical protein